LADAFSSTIDRRYLLRLAALIAANGAVEGPLLGLAGCVQATPPLPPPPQIGANVTGIDVHCHVFNARDLPIPGFVVHVALENDPDANIQLGPLITFIALLLDQSAVDAKTELAGLQAGGTPVAAAIPGQMRPENVEVLRRNAYKAALAMQANSPAEHDLTTIQHLDKVLPRAKTLLAKPLSANISGAAKGNAGDTQTARSDRLRFFATMAQMKNGGAVPGLTPPHQSGVATPLVVPALPSDATVTALSQSTPESVANAVADGVVENAKNRSGVFYLASLVTRSRSDLVAELVDLPKLQDRGDVSLFTPAMVDFTYWLAADASDGNDPDPTADPGGITSLADQIAVMSAISSRRRDSAGNELTYAVHPFVSFCPWREIAQRQAGILPPAQQQFGLVKDAILKKGFVGIKMYPLMGFRPTGNASQSADIYPARLRELHDFAAKLDLVLEQLYAWCVQNDVPIMAHCSFSQYSSVAGARLGSPQGWWEVLETHKNLRLNLAHAGGIWNLSAARAPTIEKQSGGLWPVDVVGRLGAPENPNLYADIADFSDVLSCDLPVPASSALGGLASLVAKNPASRSRIMYGTDYMFLIQTPGTENYVAKMRDCASAALGISPADLMGRNAARFLGLNNPTSGTRIRLAKFRGDHFLDRWTGV
jgi:predicted TIM-barrel fold metal-dependent hydrolase